MLWGAFTNSMTAMMAQSHCMNVISQNIVNVNTAGYKKAEDMFQTSLSETYPNWNIFGVNKTTRQSVDRQGTILGTGGNLDMAVNGQGLFILSTTPGSPTSETDYSFGRAGSFLWKVDNTATTTTAATTSTTYSVAYDDTYNNSLSRGAEPPAANLQPTYLATPDGQYLLAFAAGTDGTFTPSSTLSGLSAIRTDFYTLAAGQETQNMTLRANVDANTERSGTVNFSLPVYKSVDNPDTSVTDYLSDQLNFVLTADPMAENTWTLELTCGSNGGDDPTDPLGTASGTATGTFTLVFDGDGKLSSVSPAGSGGSTFIDTTVTWKDVNYTSSVTTTATATPVTASDISIDLSGLSQLGGNSLIYNFEQDGNVNGYLRDSYFTNDGFFVGSYTNNESKRLYQIPVATFNAPNQLDAISGTRWALSENAGDIVVRVQGGNDEGLVTFTAAAVEQSNVAMEDEFTKMIITQKAYSLATKVFQTADEMTTTVRDLK
ncbi:MAG: flagellar hook-basal body complex protein [Alphaproteobacteria bacterium]|nr:flagellar hook-basal body complex protein [Alphaproteobacteria bacterium]